MYYGIKESGKRLSELRKMKELTQQQVADELGMRKLAELLLQYSLKTSKLS